MSPDPSAAPVLLVTHVTAIDAGAVPDLLAGLGRRSRIIRANKGEPFPEDVETLGGVVSFGGPQSANDDHVEYVRAELDWIPRVMAAGVPLLGICLGSQMVARTLGATVGPDPNGLYEFGYYPIEPLEGAAQDLALDATLNVAHRHGEAFTMPAGARRLARRDMFENQAFRYGATTWALQFHPEVNDAVLARWVGSDPPAEDLGAPARRRRRNSAQTMLAITRPCMSGSGDSLRSGSPARSSDSGAGLRGRNGTMVNSLIVGITGASGAVYGVRLLEVLRETPVETHLVVSKWGQRTLEHETGKKLDDLRALANHHYGAGDMAALMSSGSAAIDGMVIAPCSARSLAAIACGLSENLIHRAADVMIKERRPLVLLVRETPLSAIHLENMLKLARLGVTIFPPVPAFYNEPGSIDEMVDYTVARALDQFGLKVDLGMRWRGGLTRRVASSER